MKKRLLVGTDHATGKPVYFTGYENTNNVDALISHDKADAQLYAGGDLAPFDLATLRAFYADYAWRLEEA